MHSITRHASTIVLVTALVAACSTDRALAPDDTVNRPLAAASARAVPTFPQSPADFVSTIDNPWLAFEPGKVFRYSAATEDGLETNIVEVTTQTKVILGVTTTVVHDRVFLDGELTEDTFDWYAQDRNGNVWYFGEDSKEIENDMVVSTEGSWEAGVNGALPGIIMLGTPKPGMRYQQELAPGVAEDMAMVIGLSATVSVEFGDFTNALRTREWTPLERGSQEFKYYVPGIGLVLELHPGGGGQRNELVSITP